MSEKYGFVYVLSNQSMPDCYKIGATCRSPSARAEELSRSTSVPQAFDVVMFAEVENPFEVESYIHSHLDPYRISSNREFFSLSPEQMIDACDDIADHSFLVCYGEDYTATHGFVESKREQTLEVVK